MKKSVLFALWGGMFIVCAGLGFIPEHAGALGIGMTLAAIVFFVPPALLLWQAVKEGDGLCVQLIRNFAAASLGLTAALIVLNILGATASTRMGDFLHAVLVVVSSPMVCSGSWALSLFLWACLLVTAVKYSKK